MAAQYPHINDAGWLAMQENGRLGDTQVYYLASVDSTNDRAMELGRRGVESGTLVVAETQTSGRGRLGREWVSPAGMGLYFSIILRPDLEPRDLPKITLCAGLAVSLALEELAGLVPKIKWPNDILLGGRKIGGILTESEGVGGQPLVIVGIGINVLTSDTYFKNGLASKATSIVAESGMVIRRSALLQGVAEKVKQLLEQLERHGFAEILGQWRQRDAALGRKLSWVTPLGEVVEGLSLGPDEEGVLHIRDQDGREHEVLSGDVHLAGRL